MRILFMGTPDFARVILESLYGSGEEIIGVVTQPDKPKGRGYKLTPSEVKVFAAEHGIPVFQPQTMKDGAFAETLSELDPDMIVVAAYGKILPPYILDYPKYGCINAHASILPKYRGASPIQRAIMNGERETGVTAMYMDAGLDTGDIILCEKVSITDEDDFESVHDKLAEAGSAAILETVRLTKCGGIVRTKQNDAESTYAAKIEKEDRMIDFSASAEEVFNKIRGLNPFPRAFTWLPDGKILQITKARAAQFSAGKEAEPGTVISCGAEGFTVVCSDGAIIVTEVIPEGRGRMSGADFVRGRKVSVGDVLVKPSSKDE
ncbi:MAG: methionyl-tRNA formyltransferase [Clostridia bacterium]|nr:methionyl-tRNA formyltransferase [Clostridia bacterium]